MRQYQGPTSIASEEGALALINHVMGMKPPIDRKTKNSGLVMKEAGVSPHKTTFLATP
jgi:hypothetical protein